MPAVVIAAGIGAAATVYASNKAASASKKAAAQNAATIDKTQAANNALYDPYIKRGNAAGDAINNFLGLNGTQGQDNAFDAYKKSTGYQFQIDSGSDAIASNKAAQGLLKSGSTLKGLTTYGQNVASTTTQNYLNNLSGQQGVGANAAGGNASSNSNAAGMQVANTNNALSNQTDSISATSNALTNLLGQASSAYNYSKGMSSYLPGQSGGSGNSNGWESANTNWGLG